MIAIAGITLVMQAYQRYNVLWYKNLIDCALHAMKN